MLPQSGPWMGKSVEYDTYCRYSSIYNPNEK